MSPDNDGAALTAADDAFHLGETEDRSWTETSWFSAQIPERQICVWTYPLFRWERGIMSCGVYIWDGSGENPWELPYYRTWAHLGFPSDQSPTELVLDNGLKYSTKEPLSTYRVQYEDADEVALDFEYRAIHDPKGVGVSPGGHGHIDQLGHVVGTLELHGERLEIDCYEMRDRTWSPRRESRQGAYVSYSYGVAGDSSAFHISKRYSRSSGELRFMSGFVLTELGQVDVDDGDVRVLRDADGRPEAVEVDLALANGDRYEASGEVESRFAMPPSPWFTWASTVRWSLPDGSTAYGEHQDTWGLQALRGVRRGAEQFPFFEVRR